eukprot:scaffold31320_cov18-Tisochrysis_lutea.AAC.1
MTELQKGISQRFAGSAFHALATHHKGRVEETHPAAAGTPPSVKSVLSRAPYAVMMTATAARAVAQAAGSVPSNTESPLLPGPLSSFSVTVLPLATPDALPPHSSPDHAGATPPRTAAAPVSLDPHYTPEHAVAAPPHPAATPVNSSSVALVDDFLAPVKAPCAFTPAVPLAGEAAGDQAATLALPMSTPASISSLTSTLPLPLQPLIFKAQHDGASEAGAATQIDPSKGSSAMLTPSPSPPSAASAESSCPAPFLPHVLTQCGNIATCVLASDGHSAVGVQIAEGGSTEAEHACVEHVPLSQISAPYQLQQKRQRNNFKSMLKRGKSCY